MALWLDVARYLLHFRNCHAIRLPGEVSADAEGRSLGRFFAGLPPLSNSMQQSHAASSYQTSSLLASSPSSLSRILRHVGTRTSQTQLPVHVVLKLWNVSGVSDASEVVASRIVADWPDCSMPTSICITKGGMTTSQASKDKIEEPSNHRRWQRISIVLVLLSRM